MPLAAKAIARTITENAWRLWKAKNATIVQPNAAKARSVALARNHWLSAAPAAAVISAPRSSVTRAKLSTCVVAPPRYPAMAAAGLVGMSRCDSIMLLVWSVRMAALMVPNPNTIRMMLWITSSPLSQANST